MWNFGKWGLYISGAVFVGLATGAVRRRMSYALNHGFDTQETSNFRRIAAVLSFVLGYVLLINAQTTSQDLCGFSERIEDIGQRLAASPHRLIRELDAFREDIPTVELVKHGGVRHFSYSNAGELLWYWILGTVSVLMSVLTLARPSTHRWTWRGHWKPSASVTSALLAPLLFLTGLTHFTGGTRYSLHELCGHVDVEHTTTAFVEWAEQSGYHIRSDGTWLFQTIPDGSTVGSLHLAQLEIASVFDRWKTSLGGVVEKSPSFEIQVVASEEPIESSIHVTTRQAMIGPATYWWKEYPARELEKSLLTALKSVTDYNSGTSPPAEEDESRGSERK